MDLKLTDIEANSVKHALEHYLKNLESGREEKGVKFEEDAAKSVIQKIVSASGASGI